MSFRYHPFYDLGWMIEDAGLEAPWDDLYALIRNQTHEIKLVWPEPVPDDLLIEWARRNFPKHTIWRGSDGQPIMYVDI